MQVTLNMPWKKARKQIKDDVRYINFTDSDYVSCQGICLRRVRSYVFVCGLRKGR